MAGQSSIVNNTMKVKNLVIILFVLCSSLASKGQVDQPARLIFNFDGGVNYSYLTYNFENGNNFQTPEIWIRGTLVKPLASHISIRSGLGFGVKKKTKPYETTSLPTSSPYYSMMKQVDETMSSADHYYLEIPISIFYDFKKIRLGAGVLGRHYFNTASGSQPDWLSGSYEVGIQPIIAYKFNKEISIELDYYAGLTSLFSQITLDGVVTKVNNNFIGLNLSYTIR